MKPKLFRIGIKISRNFKRNVEENNNKCTSTVTEFESPKTEVYTELQLR